MNVSLPDPVNAGVEERARSGRHINASDDKGVASGAPVSFDLEAFLARKGEAHTTEAQ